MTARWIDLVDPTREEILTAVAARLDPDAIESLVAPAGEGRDVRPAFEGHGSYVLGVFLVPHRADHRSEVEYRELDVIATSDAVVTVRKATPGGSVADCDALAVRAEEGMTAGRLVHAIVDDVADSFLGLADGIFEQLDALEDEIDEIAPRAGRLRIAAMRHELLFARRIVSATRAAVHRVSDGRIETTGEPLFPPEVERAFADTWETLVRAVEDFDIARDLLAGSREFLQGKIAENQNEVVKRLTVVASLVLVPTLITGFYGQNFEGAFDDRFWTLGVSLGLIVVSTIVQLVMFRRFRWI